MILKAIGIPASLTSAYSHWPISWRQAYRVSKPVASRSCKILEFLRCESCCQTWGWGSSRVTSWRRKRSSGCGGSWKRRRWESRSRRFPTQTCHRKLKISPIRFRKTIFNVCSSVSLSIDAFASQPVCFSICQSVSPFIYVKQFICSYVDVRFLKNN